MRRIFQALIAGVFLLGVGTSRAQFIWTGAGTTDNLLSDPSNWQSMITPGGVSGSENLTFGDIGVAPHFNILVPTSAFNDISFMTSSRPNYTFSGSGGSPVLTINGVVLEQSGPDVVFNSNLSIVLGAAGGNFNIASGARMMMNGSVSGSVGLTLVGGGELHFGGTASYTGNTVVRLGTLSINGGFLNQSTANLTLGQSTSDDGLLFIAGGGSVSVNIGTLGNAAGSRGDADVTNGTWDNRTYLYVGAAGSGTLTIGVNGTVTSPDISIGNNSGGDGSVTVDGAGSHLTIVNTIYAGSAGDGQLYITNGGIATSTTGSIGNNSGGIGLVLVADSGSTWSNSGALLIGNATTGELGVNDLASVSAGSATVGVLGGVSGTLSLDNLSSFTTTGNLIIGGSGDGYFSVSAGAHVTTGGFGAVGNNAGSISSAFLSGPGTNWNLTGDLYVGNGGQGILYLLDSAIVTIGGGSGTLDLGHSAGGDGQLYFGYDGEGNGPSGVLNAAVITTTGGVGEVLLGASSTKLAPFYLTKDGTSGGANISVQGSVQVLAINGYSVMAGTNTYTGGTTITSGATLVAGSNSALGTGTVQLTGGQLVVAPGVTLSNPLSFLTGSVLSGNGTFGSNITVDSNVVLSPGSSPGTLSFSSGLTLAPGGSLVFEVQTAGGSAGTGYDLLSISGAPLNITATSGSPFVVRLTSLNGSGAAGLVADFSSSTNYSWIIATSSSGITGFAANKFTLDVTDFLNASGPYFSFAQSGNNLLLNYTPVPEPSTWVLMVMGMTAFGLLLRKQRFFRGR